MKQNITIILLIVLIVVSTLLLVNVLTKNRMPDESFKELVRSLNDHIESLKENRDQFRTMYMEEIANSHRKDSLLQLKEKVIINNYEKIAPAVDNLSDNELISKINEWANSH